MMTTQGGAAYLEMQVKTASPQKLRLMLIDAALRFARKTVEDWSANQEEAAFESLQRCRAIVAELLAGISPDAVESPLARQVANIYLIVFRTLSEAQAERSEKKMGDVIRVLDIERETWRAVCDQTEIEATPAQDASAAFTPSRSKQSPAPIPPIAMTTLDRPAGLNLQG